MTDGSICTCRDRSCPFHPTNHDRGCEPCIRKNLALGEIPNCFFNKITDDLDSVEAFTMEGFAHEVLKREKSREKEEKRIGMLVAVEIGAVLNKYGRAEREHDAYGFKVYEYALDGARLFVVHSGAGEIAAAAATQLLITAYHVGLVVNFGVVGGLTDDMKLARTVVVRRVVHYDFDTSALDGCEVGRYLSYPSVFLPLDAALVEKALEVEPTLVPVTCASGDKFVDGPEKKKALHESFEADICEMELAAIVLTCDRSRVPCLALKTVSDAVQGGAEDFLRTVDSSANIGLRITEKIIREL